MSDEGSFLARWSRRKREAAARRAEDGAKPGTATRAVEQTEFDTPVAATSAVNAERAAVPSTEPAAFDISQLPPIESITAATDVRTFLAPGVPAELTRAALRRAWSADPAIRDFVGIAENQWDFATPGATPGFGPLDATDEIRRLVERIVGSPAAGEGEPELPPQASGETEPQQLSGDLRPAGPESLSAPSADGVPADVTMEPERLSARQDRPGDTAMQQDGDFPKMRKGGKGGALPR